MIKPDTNNILEVNNLKMYFPVTRGLLRKRISNVKAVDDISFSIKRGETLGLVGESGCGKTTVGRTILRVYKPTSGQIIFEDNDISGFSKHQLKPLRGKMQLIFQDPYGSLDPRQTAGSIVGEVLKINKIKNNGRNYKARIEELFEIVGLAPSMTNRYPHEFSGGQRQRIGIARALASDPSLIICDEPISALDVSIQAQVINLLQELQERLELTFLFIAHDLSVVRHISSRVAVMYLGRIVEITNWKELYENPLNPYTQALLSAVPIPDPFIEEKRKNIYLNGDVPSPINPPSGCNFHTRCPLAVNECVHVIPPLRKVASDHEVACIRV